MNENGPVNRRTALSMGSVGVIMALTGCSAFSPLSSEGTYIRSIRLENEDNQEHTLNVQVERNNTIVHEESYTLGPRESGQQTGEHHTIDSTWLEDPATFNITIEEGDTKIEKEYDTPSSLSSSEDEFSCMNILFKVDDQGSFYTYTAGCQKSELGNSTDESGEQEETETEEPVGGLAELHVRLREDENRKEIDDIIPSDHSSLANSEILQDAFDDAVETGLSRYTTRNEATIDKLAEAIVEIPMNENGQRYVDHDDNLLSVNFGVND